MKTVLELAESAKNEFETTTGKIAKVIYLPTSFIYQLESELTKGSKIDTILGMKIKFLPGLNVENKIIVSDN